MLATVRLFPSWAIPNVDTTEPNLDQSEVLKLLPRHTKLPVERLLSFHRGRHTQATTVAETPLTDEELPKRANDLNEKELPNVQKSVTDVVSTNSTYAENSTESVLPSRTKLAIDNELPHATASNTESEPPNC